MTESFKVGEIAVGHGYVIDVEYNGMECEILTPLQDVLTWNKLVGKPIEGLQHEVRWADGSITFQYPYELRKKRPPDVVNREVLGEWDLCPWQPAKVKANAPTVGAEQS